MLSEVTQVENNKLLVLDSGETDGVWLDLFSFLEKQGFVVNLVTSPEQYLSSITESDLVLVPISKPGAELLNELVNLENHAPTLLFGKDSLLAGRMMLAGADEYFLQENSDIAIERLQFCQQLIERTIASRQIIHQSMTSLDQQSASLQRKVKSMTEDQLAAFNVQQKLLPEPQQFDDIAFGYRLVPRSGMSGDSVNCFELNDGRLLFYLADVAGHGILGGVIATALTFTARNLASPEFDCENQSSADLLVWFNEAMLELKLDRHVAMFLGVISADRKTLEYSSAAHFPGTILCQDDHCLYLDLGGLPLGVCKTEYDCRTVNLKENFELVLFSDGVLEILPKDSLENRENHLISLIESGSRSVSDISSKLSLEGLTEIPDDIAVLTIRRDGSKKDEVLRTA